MLSEAQELSVNVEDIEWTPMGAVQDRTSFPEDTIYLFNSYGPLAIFGPDGNIIGITDAGVMKALAGA